MPSEDALRAGAVACFTNVQGLYEEAKLLFEQDHFPRSAALALIGAEELAQSHRLPPKLDGHELKHHICGLAYDALAMIREWEAATDEYGGFTPMGRLTELFSVLARGGLDRLLDKEEAQQYYRTLRAEHAQVGAEQDIFLQFRGPDFKNAALYVDLDLKFCKVKNRQALP